MITLFAHWALSTTSLDTKTPPETIDSPISATEVPAESFQILEEEVRRATKPSNAPEQLLAQGDGQSVSTTEAQALPNAIQQPPVTNESGSAQSPIPISNAHAEMLGDSGGRSSKHAEIEAEPKDDNWSYFMEQSLMLFVSQHRNSELFSIFNIECRTTLCEIQVIGYNESTSPDWQRILFDLHQQPWYDFGQVGTSNSEYQGQLAIVTHLTRRR